MSIPVAYDIAKLDDPDDFNPTDHFEATGEDLGVPEEYMKRFRRGLELAAKHRGEAGGSIGTLEETKQ